MPFCLAVCNVSFALHPVAHVIIFHEETIEIGLREQLCAAVNDSAQIRLQFIFCQRLEIHQYNALIFFDNNFFDVIQGFVFMSYISNTVQVVILLEIESQTVPFDLCLNSVFNDT